MARSKEKSPPSRPQALGLPLSGLGVSGDADADLAYEPPGLEAVLRRLDPRVRALLWRYRIPPSDRDDVFQEAILAMLRAGEEVADRERWCFATARNLCAEYHRRRKCWERLVEPVDPATLCGLTPAIDPPQSAAEAKHDLQTALDLSQLSDNERKLIRLRYGYGLASHEIASRMGCHQGNVRKATAKALARLRQAFESLAEVAPHRRSPE